MRVGQNHPTVTCPFISIGSSQSRSWVSSWFCFSFAVIFWNIGLQMSSKSDSNSMGGIDSEKVFKTDASMRFLPEVPVMFKMANFRKCSDLAKQAPKALSDLDLPRMTMNSVEPKPISPFSNWVMSAVLPFSRHGVIRAIRARC